MSANGLACSKPPPAAAYGQTSLRRSPASRMRVTNVAAANDFLKREYRTGW